MNQIKDIKPMVSVVMITYNHEAFIAEAIEGVLMQDADFPIEFIIADDCSPDRTNEIVQNYINKHPNGKWITYTRHPNNKGMMPNFIWALEQAKGKYIALCEGDDYWTDPLKLQKQVGLLEKDNGVLCHSGAVNSMGRTISKSKEDEDTIQKLIMGNYIITGSVIFNKEILDHFNWFKKDYPFGDWPLWLTASCFGKILFIEDITTVYRINNSGIWQNNWKDRIGSKRVLSEIELLEEFEKAYPQYILEVRKAIFFRLQKLTKFYMETGSYGLILREPLKKLLKPFPEFNSLKKKARQNYIKVKLGL